MTEGTGKSPLQWADGKKHKPGRVLRSRTTEQNNDSRKARVIEKTNQEITNLLARRRAVQYVDNMEWEPPSYTRTHTMADLRLMPPDPPFRIRQMKYNIRDLLPLLSVEDQELYRQNARAKRGGRAKFPLIFERTPPVSKRHRPSKPKISWQKDKAQMLENARRIGLI